MSLSTRKLVIIADDLTGVNDAGAQFAKRGYSTCVFANWAHLPQLAACPQTVLAINAASRDLDESEARARMATISHSCRAQGIRRVYKKTDSTGRGNIGAECDALLATYPERSLIFAPALPRASRTVCDGVLYVDGRPVAETEFARDPLHPVSESNFADILGRQTRRSIVSVSADALQAGQLPPLLPGAIYTLDGLVEADLQRAAELCAQATTPLLFAGPAGLAAYLFFNDWPAPVEPEPLDLPTPILTVNGSVHPSSLAQVRFALRAGFFPCRIPPEALPGSRPPTLSATAKAASALEEGLNVLLFAASDEASLAACRDRGLTPVALSRATSLAIARWTQAIVARCPPRSLLVLGGETSQTVLQSLGIDNLILLGEVDTGLNVLRPAGRTNPKRIATKSGGFGKTNLLSRLAASNA